MREVERLEISFDPNNPPTPPFRKGGEYILYSGYQIVGDQLRRLPIGSTLNSAKGTFSWMPGPGFLGSYDLVFIRSGAGDSCAAFRVRVEIVSMK